MPIFGIIDGITGQSPFNIYICNVDGTGCFYLSTVTTIPYYFTIPSPYDNLSQYMMKVVDSNNCTITGTTTISNTPVPTPTPTLTPGYTPSNTPTVTLTPTITKTVTLTRTLTPSITPTKSITPSITPTKTIFLTPTITPTITKTPTNTITKTVTASPAVTRTPTRTPTKTPTNTATPTPTTSITVVEVCIVSGFSETQITSPQCPSYLDRFGTYTFSVYTTSGLPSIAPANIEIVITGTSGLGPYLGGLTIPSGSFSASTQIQLEENVNGAPSCPCPCSTITTIESISINNNNPNYNFTFCDFNVTPTPTKTSTPTPTNTPSVGSTLTISFTEIPFSDPDIISPMRGPEWWNGTTWDNQEALQIPNGTTGWYEGYVRLDWYELQNDDGTYSLNNSSYPGFDFYMKRAIDNQQKFSFKVMSVCDASGCGPIKGNPPAQMHYPLYLHNLLQAESPAGDWYFDGNGDYGNQAAPQWIPNWNSPTYLAELRALLQEMRNMLDSTYYKGVRYIDAIHYIDISGFGNYGEWHMWPFRFATPSYALPTTQSLIEIVEISKDIFPDKPLIINIGAFSNTSYAAISSEFTYYALTTQNDWGYLGWRRDNLGDVGYESILDYNPWSYNGLQFSTAIMERWKYSPIGGEPYNVMSTVTADYTQAPFYSMFGEVQKYGISQFGNGNYPGNSIQLQSGIDNVKNAFKRSGYRLKITTAQMPSTSLSNNIPFNITLNWQNVGVAPLYENWGVYFQLRNGSNVVVWEQLSIKNLKLFLPNDSPTPTTDTLTITGVTPGTYTLNIVIKDPTNFYPNLPLAIQGRTSYGGYVIKTGVAVT